MILRLTISTMLTIFLSAALNPFLAQADNIVDVSAGSCVQSISMSTTATAFCTESIGIAGVSGSQTASGIANYGTLKAGALITATSFLLAQGAGSGGVGAGAGATSHDFLNFSGSGVSSISFLSITDQLTGDVSVISGGEGSQFGSASGGLILQLMPLDGSAPTGECDIQVASVAVNISQKCTATVVVNSGSRIGLTFRLVALTSAVVSGNHNDFVTANANFADTGLILGVQAFNSQMQPLDNVIVTGDSGLVYSSIAPPISVSEPSTLVMLVGYTDRGSY